MHEILEGKTVTKHIKNLEEGCRFTEAACHIYCMQQCTTRPQSKKVDQPLYTWNVNLKQDTADDKIRSSLLLVTRFTYKKLEPDSSENSDDDIENINIVTQDSSRRREQQATKRTEKAVELRQKIRQ